MHRRTLHSIEQENTPKKREDFWPAGIILVISLVVMIGMFFSVSPRSVKDIPVFNSYLIVVFLSMSVSFTAIVLLTIHIRRALMWSVCITLLFWLQLQHVLDIWVLLFVLSPFILSELALTVGKKK